MYMYMYGATMGLHYSKCICSLPALWVKVNRLTVMDHPDSASSVQFCDKLNMALRICAAHPVRYVVVVFSCARVFVIVQCIKWSFQSSSSSSMP